MDARLNPYNPGAGNPPPALAGRDELLERLDVAMDRLLAGRPARGFVLYGLRGVGKTVLLNHVLRLAQTKGIHAVNIETPEAKSMLAPLVLGLRTVLIKLSKSEAAKEYGSLALRALGGFVRSLKLKFNDVEFGMELPVEKGLADSGDLTHDMGELLVAVGQAAKEQNTAVILFIDELQHAVQEQLAALITAFHFCAQQQLPVSMVGAGLPQLLGQMGDAKSYAERLFEFSHIDRLDEANARTAVEVPAKREGVDFDPAALQEIISQTAGYPYFLQEWGKHSWAIAEQSPVTVADAKEATHCALAELDASFFRVRLDRLTASEKKYIRAMAELGPSPHRSGDIATCLGRKVESVAPIRNSLIRKGMIYAPSHGDTAFTVPLFDEYLRRIIPSLSEKADSLA